MAYHDPFTLEEAMRELRPLRKRAKELTAQNKALQDEVEKAYKEGRDWGAAERNRLNQIILSDTIAKKQLLEALKDLIDCPYEIDPATVSEAGLEATMQASPYQVVGNMSVTLIRVRKARAAIAAVEGEKE